MRSFTLLIFLLSLFKASAQDGPPATASKGIFSGNFQTNTQLYDRDDKIGANTTQYLRQLSSTDAWLFMNYNVNGFNFALRYDVFNNSPLLNPQESFTAHGIGFWQISKDIDKLNVTIGSFYEQFATGMVFRSYEDRLIGIDYALEGIKLKYNITDNFIVKGFTGKQKGSAQARFETSPQVIKGVNLENRFQLKDNVSLDLGTSLVNRTLDANTMNTVAAEINSQPLQDRFNPKWNTFAYNGYATLSLKNFTLYGEYVHKTHEAIKTTTGQLIDKPGNIYYGSATYSKSGLGSKKRGGFGWNAQVKKIDNFQFRTSPFESLLNGQISYLPSLTRQNTYRLLARYNSVVQELGEMAIQTDIVYTPQPGSTMTFNYSKVQSPTGVNYFEEYYADYAHKFPTSHKLKNFKFVVGLQSVFYNQEVYEVKPGAKNVSTLTPFGEVVYKIDKKRSLRFECQYLDTKQDLGSFVNAVVEYNVAPHFSFSVSDMVNNKPYRSPGSVVSDEIIHYYTFFGAYTIKTSRFTLGYIKQVEGVNCTGGVCRVEPAFSGVRFSLTTNF